MARRRAIAAIKSRCAVQTSDLLLAPALRVCVCVCVRKTKLAMLGISDQSSEFGASNGPSFHGKVT